MIVAVEVVVEPFTVSMLVTTVPVADSSAVEVVVDETGASVAVRGGRITVPLAVEEEVVVAVAAVLVVVVDMAEVGVGAVEVGAVPDVVVVDVGTTSVVALVVAAVVVAVGAVVVAAGVVAEVGTGADAGAGGGVLAPLEVATVLAVSVAPDVSANAILKNNAKERAAGFIDVLVAAVVVAAGGVEVAIGAVLVVAVLVAVVVATTLLPPVVVANPGIFHTNVSPTLFRSPCVL